MKNKDLIMMAAEVIRPHETPQGRLIGDVGAAVLSQNGNIFTGVCVDTPSWGLCAERAAAAAMITQGEYVAAKVVAVWRKHETGELYVLPPCGHCREFFRDLDPANLDAQFVLGFDKTATLSELMPAHQWPEPLQP